jgi:hypothetical protein
MSAPGPAVAEVALERHQAVVEVQDPACRARWNRPGWTPTSVVRHGRGSAARTHDRRSARAFRGGRGARSPLGLVVDDEPQVPLMWRGRRRVEVVKQDPQGRVHFLEVLAESSSTTSVAVSSPTAIMPPFAPGTVARGGSRRRAGFPCRAHG